MCHKSANRRTCTHNNTGHVRQSCSPYFRSHDHVTRLPFRSRGMWHSSKSEFGGFYTGSKQFLSHSGVRQNTNQVLNFRPNRKQPFRSAQIGAGVFSLAIKYCTQYEKKTLEASLKTPGVKNPLEISETSKHFCFVALEMLTVERCFCFTWLILSG